MNKKILVVDDEEGICLFIKQNLEQIGFETDYILRGKEALIKYKNYDLAILDIKMPEISGIEVLNHIKQDNGGFPVIVMSAFGDYKQASELLTKGADDYLQKPFNVEDMIFRVQKTIEMHRLMHEVNVYKSEKLENVSKIVYKSNAIKEILEIVDKISSETIPVLITGESGTGKELIAQAIHYNSNNPRKDNLLSIVNCGALTETLLDDELFGHIKGAFTGAINEKDGFLEVTDGGTLFLDEIADATISTQAKLLRAVETGEFRKLGDTRIHNSDVRIIVATNKTIPDMVRKGLFREDLYQRLKGIEIHIPPLRERKDDIPELVNFFISTFNKELKRKVEFHSESIEKLKDYEWKGNVRELKHTIQKIILLSEDETITPKFVENILHFKTNKNKFILEEGYKMPENIGEKSFLEQKTNVVKSFEKQFLQNLMKECKGNLSHASKKAKIDRKHLREKLKKYKIKQKLYQ